MDGGETTGFWLTRLLLQRGLAFIYLVAFLVAANQFRGLLGSHGLLPVPHFLERARFRDSPSLFFLHYSDGTAVALAWLGVALAAFALTGLSERFGTPVSMAVWGALWVLYLSFVNVGQVWYGFGWEMMLLESGFLAVFLGARDVAPPVVVIWMFRWELFRVMLGAGLIKLRGDPCWRELTCLRWHYETQPIPNPLSWYLAKLPMWVHEVGGGFTLFVELLVPFGYFAARRLAPVAWIAGALTVVFQGMLILSGNLSWLNWLTIVLAFACFDDRLLHHLLPVRAPPLAPPALPYQVALWALVAVVVFLSIRPTLNLFMSRQVMNASFEPLHLVNTYGAFGSVTRERDEIILEGTADSVPTAASAWKPYAFKAKPGDPSRAPAVITPYHLRLDWLMWFAAMSSPAHHPWVLSLVGHLLEGDRAVIGLLAGDPFPDHPPRWIRARLYRYRFSTRAERRATGRWWERTLLGEYLPPLSLSDPRFRAYLEAQGWLEGAAVRRPATAPRPPLPRRPASPGSAPRTPPAPGRRASPPGGPSRSSSPRP